MPPCFLLPSDPRPSVSVGRPLGLGVPDPLARITATLGHTGQCSGHTDTVVING